MGDLHRREFLAGIGALCATRSFECIGASVAAQRPLRFLAVADIHYRPGVFPHDNREWLERILARAEAENVDFAIQLGDFVHAAKRDRAYVDLWNDSRIQVQNVVGNHDDDGGSHSETLEAFRLERGWYSFESGGFRFLVLDTNYALIDGRYIHYGKDGRLSGKCLEPDSKMRLHPEEIEWLEEELLKSTLPCVVVSHKPLDGTDPDSRAVQKTIETANKANPGRVVLALNGHRHSDRWNVVDGVPFFTVNSANHHWIAKRHTAYPREDVERWREIDHIIAYDTPLSAIVTLHPGGTVSVVGQEGRFWRGIDPAEMGWRGRISPSIANRPAKL